jgi:WD40 repeat protein
VYALGAILYECLTGRPPFKAATAMDTLLLVLSEEPVPPRRLQPQVPADLETICLKCLEKEPRKRYASAAALAEDLRRFQAREPIAARPVGCWERGVKWAKRRPAVAGLLTALMLAILGLVCGATWFTLRLNEALGTSEAKRDEAEQARRAADVSAEAEKGAREKAQAAQKHAEEEKQAADQARQQADRARTKAEWLAYAGQIALAQREWQDGNVRHARDLLDVCQWDLRGWERNYLYTLFNKNRRTLRGHSGSVISVAFSPDGKRLVSGSQDKTVKMWDAQTGREILTLKGHTDSVMSVGFSPDGKRLASGSADGIKVWDVQTGQEILSLKGHSDGATSVAFSPDGKRLVSGWGRILDGPDKWVVKVSDAQTGQETHTLEGHTDLVTCVAFSPDGKRLVSGSWDQTVKVWDAQTGQLTFSLKGHTGRVKCVAFSPDGRRLVSGSGRLLSDDEPGEVKVWNTATGEAVLTLKGHNEVCSVAFSPDGKRLLSGSRYDTIKVWDAQTGREILSLEVLTGDVSSVAFSPDGKRLAIGSGESDQQGRPLSGEVKVWDVQTSQEALFLQGHSGWVSSVAFSPDGKRLVSGGDQAVKVWDAQTGQETLCLKGHTGRVQCVAFSPDGKRLVSGSAKYAGLTPLPGELKVWDAQTGQQTLALDGHTGPIHSMAFSPDGKCLVSGSGDGFDQQGTRLPGGVKVWDTRTGKEILSLKGDTVWVYSVAFSPDGKRLVSVSGGYAEQGRLIPAEVTVWNAQTGDEMLSLKGHTSSVRSVAFSPNGQRLVSGSDDKTVKMWDAQTGREILTLKGHTDSVMSVAFSPDGKRLLSGSADKTVKMWDTQTGQETLTLKGHTGPVHNVAFSPDGKRLASASGDGTVKVWDGSHVSDKPLVGIGAPGR